MTNKEEKQAIINEQMHTGDYSAMAKEYMENTHAKKDKK